MTERTRIWPMYRAMVGVGLACGLLIVGVFVGTKPVIARNRAEALRAAIFEVLPPHARAARFVSRTTRASAPTRKAPAAAGWCTRGMPVAVVSSASRSLPTAWATRT